MLLLKLIRAKNRSKYCNILAGVIILLHIFLLIFNAICHSPILYETGHVPAGICHWQHQMFHLYRVNPPLPRMVATFPLLFIDTKVDWTNYGMSPLSREEIPMGVRFADSNGERIFWLFTIARFANISFAILAALVCFHWSSLLWRKTSGLISLSLWCFNPIILGNGALVMPDVPAAAMGITASYFFWQWLKSPSWTSTILTGIILGLAELCKTTLLVFFLIWPIVWLLTRGIKQTQEETTKTKIKEVNMIIAMLGLAISVLNMGYGFTGSFQKLGDFTFISKSLNGLGPENEHGVGNRFTDIWLGHIPVPLPADYLQGIDRQKADFEFTDRSYLNGEWKQGGWWYYYLYALAIKTPVGTLLLVVLAIIATIISKNYRASFTDELCLLLPFFAIIGLISSQTGFNNHVRYTIPALPFIFIWMGKVGRSFVSRNRMVSLNTIFALIWTMGSSLYVYPHSLSYFNELVGGPKNGHYHLLDSNISCGQDLLLLHNWLDKHPEVKKIDLACISWVDPRLAGIEFGLPPRGPSKTSDALQVNDKTSVGPIPGWYAIDVNYLHAIGWPAPNGKGKWTKISTKENNYEYFLKFDPVDRIGYSINIYHISAEEANRVRHELGLGSIATD